MHRACLHNTWIARAKLEKHMFACLLQSHVQPCPAFSEKQSSEPAVIRRQLRRSSVPSGDCTFQAKKSTRNENPTRRRCNNLLEIPWRCSSVIYSWLFLKNSRSRYCCNVWALGRTSCVQITWLMTYHDITSVYKLLISLLDIFWNKKDIQCVVKSFSIFPIRVQFDQIFTQLVARSSHVNPELANLR